MDATPRISVIVVAYNSARTIRACLSALARQTDRHFDLLVVDSSTDETPVIIQREFPHARLLHSDTRLYPGAARNWGVAAAPGDIVAFVDSDCLADTRWIARLRESHSCSSAAAVGGSVAPANPESVIAWGAYLCEFSSWLPSGQTRRMPDIPTCNISYKRQALEQYGPFRESGYCSDTALNWKLTAAGDPPLFVPNARVAHFNLSRLSVFISKQLMHGQAFARMRSQERQLDAWRRGALVVGCVLLPAVLLARIVTRALRAGLAPRCLQSLPVIVLGLSAWSWGEAKGYARPS